MDAAKLTEFANLLVAQWSPITYVHGPVPVDRSDDSYFEPLCKLTLSPGRELSWGSCRSMASRPQENASPLQRDMSPIQIGSHPCRAPVMDAESVEKKLGNRIIGEPQLQPRTQRSPSGQMSVEVKSAVDSIQAAMPRQLFEAIPDMASTQLVTTLWDMTPYGLKFLARPHPSRC
jgi:hypothetical protein